MHMNASPDFEYTPAGLTELEVDSRELQARLMEKETEVAALKAELEGMQEVSIVNKSPLHKDTSSETASLSPHARFKL